MMHHKFYFMAALALLLIMTAAHAQPSQALQVKVAQGILEGTESSGIRIYKGVPFAAPPVGPNRWKEPQPLAAWQGVRQAKEFGARPIQKPLFSDMKFRSPGISEDCLYLNVWTPAKTGKEKLPVLVYFYGGGLMAGDASELRYDGESLAREGIVAVTVNYRLGIFGFFSHPELTQESPHHASGNYGFLDQTAALLWVKQNIAVFGGDPGHVSIAGESAGSFSVSAQMASPLAKPLFQAAIGESGAVTGKYWEIIPLKDAEKAGEDFAKKAGANTLAALRQLPAEKLLTLSVDRMGPMVIDGYFFPKHPSVIFEKGEQAHVPLLAGWNSQEGSAASVFGEKEHTPENFKQILQEKLGKDAPVLSTLYNASATDVDQVATDFATDQFIAYGTWRLLDLQAKTGQKPVYRYYYCRPRPGDAGAVHSAEIEYALGNLPTNRVFDWQPDDYTVSAILKGYFIHFIKTYDPNGLGLPYWPAVKPNQDAQVQQIDVDTKTITEQHRNRYLGLEKLDETLRPKP